MKYPQKTIDAIASLYFVGGLKIKNISIKLLISEAEIVEILDKIDDPDFGYLESIFKQAKSIRREILAYTGEFPACPICQEFKNVVPSGSSNGNKQFYCKVDKYTFILRKSDIHPTSSQVSS